MNGSGNRLPYAPGVDGLRALAVLAVLLYHADQRWIPGGFLGVEVFFVISGYLITSLLLGEWRANGAIELGGFWLRRARRLLPALFLLLAAVTTYAALFLPEELAGLRGDVGAAFGYATNWYLIFHHVSYFESMGRPSLLQHLWSLAVEEQFYLVWPLICAAGLRVLRPRGFGLLVATGAIASMVWMALLFDPASDASRIYYGTDTRASGLLLGALLALVWTPGREHIRARAVVALEVAGVAGLTMLVMLHLRLGEFDPALYRGGLAAVGLATVLVIAAAVDPRTRFGRALGVAPLRWLGLRSYGIYLWHWPVFMVTRPGLDVSIDGLELLALRLGVTLALAELSYRLVELPVRQGALGRAWRSAREGAWLSLSPVGLQRGSALLAVSALSVFLVVSMVDAKPAAGLPYDAPTSVRPDDPRTLCEAVPESCYTPTMTVTVTSPPARTETATRPPPTPLAPTESPTPTVPPTATEPPAPPVPTVAPVRVYNVLSVGDSVMLGALTQLRALIPGVAIDAEVGRQASTFVEVLREYRASGQLGKVVIVQFGNNGPASTSAFDDMMRALDGVELVVVVDVRVPKPWEDASNSALADGASRYANAVLVDWHAASAGHREYFARDGTHLTQTGAWAYANLIAGALQ